MLPVSDAVRAEEAHREEAEGEVERRECEVDAYGRPSVLAGELTHALRDGEVG